MRRDLRIFVKRLDITALWKPKDLHTKTKHNVKKLLEENYVISMLPNTPMENEDKIPCMLQLQKHATKSLYVRYLLKPCVSSF